jgi:hypothetical protein
MSFGKIILFGLSFLAGIALVFVIAKISTGQPDIVNDAVAQEDKEIIAKSGNTPDLNKKSTGSVDEGDVLMQLHPQPVQKGKLIVKVAVNTHSVDLSRFDLKEIAVLEHEGKIFKPVKADKLGGHHSNGKIVFDIGEAINSFKIRIKGIPLVQERIYEWD